MFFILFVFGSAASGASRRPCHVLEGIQCAAGQKVALTPPPATTLRHPAARPRRPPRQPSASAKVLWRHRPIWTLRPVSTAVSPDPSNRLMKSNDFFAAPPKNSNSNNSSRSRRRRKSRATAAPAAAVRVNQTRGELRQRRLATEFQFESVVGR